LRALPGNRRILGVASERLLRDTILNVNRPHERASTRGGRGGDQGDAPGEMVERGRQAFRIGLAQAERRRIWFGERPTSRAESVELPLLSRGVIIRIRQREGEDDDVTLKLRGPGGVDQLADRVGAEHEGIRAPLTAQ
jgi:hypothetical protein